MLPRGNANCASLLVSDRARTLPISPITHTATIVVAAIVSHRTMTPPNICEGDV
jgi:hypothetical protein